MLGSMDKKSKILILLSALCLGLVFFFPLWSIDLWAPQYPEGLGMQIWLSKMSGDIDNINLLNHYIGMHPIKPDEIPELKLFIYFFSALIVFAALVALVGKRLLLHAYTVLFLLFSFAALVDFYNWEYKYGHELNPDAAIKMEGESYQPPLIGTKTLMNIEASSFPAVGGYGHIFAIGFAVGASVLEFRRSRKEKNA